MMGLMPEQIDVATLYSIVSLKRYVARHGHRLVQADGTLSDLFVSIVEAANLLGPRRTPTPRIAENAGWPTIEETEREVAACSAKLKELSADAPAAKLAKLCGLDEQPLKLLLCAIAPHRSVDLSRLYSFALADFTAKLPTVGMLAEMVADDPADAAALAWHFREDGPLVGHGLVELEDAQHWGQRTPLLHKRVLVHERVVEFTSGRYKPRAGRFGSACRLEESPSDMEVHQLAVAARPLEDLQACIRRAISDPRARPRPFLIGRRGVGRRTLLLNLLQKEHGLRLLTIDVARLPGDEARVEAELRAARREALFSGAVLLLQLDHLGDQDEQLARIERPLARNINEHPGLVAFTGQLLPAQLQQSIEDLFEISFPAPGIAEQAKIWQQAVRGAGGRDAEAIGESLAERFDLTPGLIHQAVTDARMRMLWRGANPRDLQLPVEALGEAVRRKSEHTLVQVAEPFTTTHTWEDVVLPEEVMSAIQEILAHARFRSQVFDAWGFRRKMSYGRGLSCLFSGPPGTGKTMVAAVLAKALGRELYRVDLSRVASKWVGETEKNLARVFDEAERAQVILLFDEADSLFSTRTEVKSANDRFANMEVNYLLQRMESYDGMTILTTNFDTSIDAAFKRRIRFRISFPVPDEEQRAQLWRSMLPAQAPMAAKLQFKELGEAFELSGGGIRNSVLRAAFYAAAAGEPIRIEHLRRAAIAETEEMGKLINR